MKTLVYLLGVSIALAPLMLCAAPNPAHLTHGVAQSVDLEKRILVIVLIDSGPSTFVVQVPRTRLREDGRSAMLSQLVVGRPVRVYYKREAGVFVATEIAWKRPPTPEPLLPPGEPAP